VGRGAEHSGAAMTQKIEQEAVFRKAGLRDSGLRD